MRLLQRLAEVQRHALERHVLEGERGAVPELEHETPRRDLAHRRDRRVVEVVAVRRGRDLARARGLHVELEGLVHARRALVIGQRRQPDDLVDGEARQPLGHEEPAARRDALEDGLGERARPVDEPTGVVIGDHGPRILPHRLVSPS